jgi:acyl-coenzyme A thioesterase PaaI-like protein
MTATPEQLEAFAPLEWAMPYLTSPDWNVLEYSRGTEAISAVFTRVSMYANDGVQRWLETYQKPTTPDAPVTRTMSLVKFGPGLIGFPGICHGGAVATIMDEALAFFMIANQLEKGEVDPSDVTQGRWKELHEQDKPLSEVLKGWYVTAKLDLKFLQPVLCPGLVGIETELVEEKGRGKKIRAVMKDAKGTPLMQADGLWVKVGGAAKM